MSDILQLIDEQVQAFLADNPDLAGLVRSAGEYATRNPMSVIAKPLRIDIPFREWPIREEGELTQLKTC
jgi:hypothetical protein